MNQPANQLRILKEQLIELKTVLGSFFIGTLRNILPYVNGIVMALKEVLKTIASLIGIDINLPDSMSFDIEFGEEPILLLDDVLSELDEERRAKLIVKCHNLQCIITTTDWEFKDLDAQIFTISGGKIYKNTPK